MSHENKSKNENYEGLGKLLDHDYDGIQELDNPLPGWWLMTFYGAIIFSVFYFGYYQLFGGPNLDEELQASLTEIKSQVESAAPQAVAGAVLADLLGKPEVIEKGKGVYAGKCAACHNQQLQGLIGPNLVDEYWIHGDGSPGAIRTVVQKGVLDKGVPGWETVLPPDEVDAVSVFIKSQVGSNPPNPKAPQGEKK